MVKLLFRLELHILILAIFTVCYIVTVFSSRGLLFLVNFIINYLLQCNSGDTRGSGCLVFFSEEGVWLTLTNFRPQRERYCKRSKSMIPVLARYSFDCTDDLRIYVLTAVYKPHIRPLSMDTYGLLRHNQRKFNMENKIKLKFLIIINCIIFV